MSRIYYLQSEFLVECCAENEQPTLGKWWFKGRFTSKNHVRHYIILPYGENLAPRLYGGGVVKRVTKWYVYKRTRESNNRLEVQEIYASRYLLYPLQQRILARKEMKRYFEEKERTLTMKVNEFVKKVERWGGRGFVKRFVEEGE